MLVVLSLLILSASVFADHNKTLNKPSILNRKAKNRDSKHFLASNKKGTYAIVTTNRKGKGRLPTESKKKKKKIDKESDYNANFREGSWEERSVKKNLDIPGCGGWVNLFCQGGRIDIHKVMSILELGGIPLHRFCIAAQRQS